MRGTHCKVVTGFEIGLSHLSEGKECQDFAGTCRKNETVCAIVCDGAGSEKHSAIGAEITANVVSSLVVDKFDQLWNASVHNVSTELIVQVLDELEDTSARKDIPLSSLACTISFVATQTRRNAVRFICGNLGDGMVIQREKRGLRLILGPQNGEFANQTFFVTSTNAQELLRIKKGTVPVNQIPGWLITTDGAGPLLYENASSQFAPLVLSLLEDLRTQPVNKVETNLEQILKDVLVPAAFDDCSIGVVQTVARGSNIQRRAYC